MATLQEFRQLIREEWSRLGHDPQSLTIIPETLNVNPLSVYVVRDDGARARVFRKDIDDNNREAIRQALQQFKSQRT